MRCEFYLHVCFNNNIFSIHRLSNWFTELSTITSGEGRGGIVGAWNIFENLEGHQIFWVSQGGCENVLSYYTSNMCVNTTTWLRIGGTANFTITSMQFCGKRCWFLQTHEIMVVIKTYSCFTCNFSEYLLKYGLSLRCERGSLCVGLPGDCCLTMEVQKVQHSWPDCLQCLCWWSILCNILLLLITGNNRCIILVTKKKK